MKLLEISDMCPGIVMEDYIAYHHPEKPICPFDYLLYPNKRELIWDVIWEMMSEEHLGNIDPIMDELLIGHDPFLDWIIVK